MQHPELPAKLPDQTWDTGKVGKVERPEVDRALLGALGVAHGGGQGLALLPGDGDDAVAGGRELAGDPETQSLGFPR